MSTLTVPDIPLQADNPAERLRRTAAAVRVSLHWWGTHRRLSNEQKEEVSAGYAADARFLTAGKRIIDVRHEAYRRLTSVRTQLVNYWRGITLPYTENGVRLLRQSDIQPFTLMMQDFRDELAGAERDLDAAYEEIKADARQRLGRLYDPRDYPLQVRGLFAVEWDFPAIEPPSYLMQIAPGVYEEERRRVAARFDEAVQLAEQAFASEFARLLAHLTERLSNSEDGQRRIFRDSAIGNLTEFFQRFRHLNINSNAQLDALVEQAQRLVQGVEPQDLRDNDSLRRQIARNMRPGPERSRGASGRGSAAADHPGAARKQRRRSCSCTLIAKGRSAASTTKRSTWQRWALSRSGGPAMSSPTPRVAGGPTWLPQAARGSGRSACAAKP